jgi:formylglycine-generating enzyme required for sulfatase activity
VAVSAAFAEELPKKYTESIEGAKGNKITFNMVLIAGGTFTMGSPAGEANRKEDEGPQHEVELKPFYLCATETTLDLFLQYYEETVSATRDDHKPTGKPASKPEPKPAESKSPGGEKKVFMIDGVTGPTPVYGDMTMGWGAGKRPAIAMTWENAAYFCKWLSKRTGKPYRLPTEAEWEYACRAGAKTAYCHGDDPAQLGDHAWFEDNSDAKTQPAAQKKPNAWGLYDMEGNVREWVLDFYSPKAYAECAKSNPTGPKEGKVKTAATFAHVARGGAWDSKAEELRSAARAFEEDWWRFKDPQFPKSKWWLPEMAFVGFRVACDAGAK